MMEVNEMPIAQLIVEYGKRKETKIVEEIVTRIVKQNLTQKEVKQIWDFAKEKSFYGLLNFLVEYTNREIVIREFLSRSNESILGKLIAKLGAFSKEEAELLIKLPQRDIREHVAIYISRKVAFEQLFEEEDLSIVWILIEKLGTIATKEADRLSGARNWVVRKQMVPYLSREVVIKRLLVEYSNDVVEKLLEKITAVTQEEADILIKAKNSLVRNYVASHVSRKMALEECIKEESGFIVEKLIQKIVRVDQSEANRLLRAKHHKVREFVAKNISQELVVEQLLIEESNNVVEILLQKLPIPNPDVVKRLINAKSWKVRLKVVTYVDRDVAFQQAFIEENENVAQVLITKLQKLTLQEANQLLHVKSNELKVFAVPYASYHEVITSLPYETDEKMLEAIAKRILENNK